MMNAAQAIKKGGSAPLGINAKSLHTKQPKGETKTRRFKLLRQAQKVLFRHDAESHKDQHRTCWCNRTLRGEQVNVRRSEESARFTGLSTCGSVWTCPVCAPIIQDNRRAEISMAMAEWLNNQGGQVLLMTLTHPHESDLPLAEQLAKREKAEQSFKNSRIYKRLKELHGRAGSIRALECTWGIVNGWHPHTHDLIFLKSNLVKGISAADLLDPTTYQGYLAELRDTWIKCLLKVGLGTNSTLGDMQRRAFQIQGGEKAAEYVAKFGHDEKWGISAEVTATHAKIGKAAPIFGQQHFTPFQMLSWMINENNPAEQVLLKNRFQEYAAAFTGKRALTWTPRLKTLLKVKDQTDEDILSAHETTPIPEESTVGSLTAEQFSTLTKHDHLGEFLEYVRDCCTDPDTSQADMDDYLLLLSRRTPAYSGSLRQKNHFSSGFAVIH